MNIWVFMLRAQKKGTFEVCYWIGIGIDDTL